MPHQTKKILQLLQQFESRNVTFIEADGSWPIVWERARGNHVWDIDGRKYIDLTAAFGVAAAGHANPRVIRAAQRQLAKLPHAMGDVHPHAGKAALAQKLSEITFERWGAQEKRTIPRRTTKLIPRARFGKTLFCNSGFEAVEAALKTAFLATGRPGIIAFRGAYHGLGYGALNATHRSHFRQPFLAQLGTFGHFVDFPKAATDLHTLESEIYQLLHQRKIGAVLTEPIQTRGGINIPPSGFLPLLRRICDATGTLLILDEIYTGFGRTGAWFACEHVGVTPDLISLGKALTGGFPLSACVGQASVMDRAWPASAGEAIHTSTYLGNPVGCAMALAQIEEISSRKLVQRTHRLGEDLLRKLTELRSPNGLALKCRGIGLLVGVEIQLRNQEPATEVTLALIKAMLAKGFIVLPEGEAANIIAFTPPLVASKRELNRAVRTLQELLELSQNRTASPKHSKKKTL